jgi:cardiolipin synthase (CMP-forming)
LSRLGLNLPNLITLGRLMLVPLAVWLIVNARYGTAFWVLVLAGVSDALDGYIAKRFDLRTKIGALLDPIADKALLVSLYVTLGIAGQLPSWLVILVVFRDAMIVGGFVLIQAIAAPPRFEPLYVSKVNTALQIVLVGFVLARLGLAVNAHLVVLALVLAVAVTTALSGLLYLVRWARIVARSEEAL